MKITKSNKKENIVNMKKLVYIPLFIGLAAIIIISITSYYTAKYILLDQRKDDGLNLAEHTAREIEGNTNSLDVINGIINDKIFSAAMQIVENRDNLSTNWLEKMAISTGVFEINWFSPQGRVLYSNVPRYVGWTTPIDHPVENFIRSGQNRLVEEIRKDTESDNYNKYGYLRNDDGTFVQVGIRSNVVESLTQKFSYQTLVEEMVDDKNVVYAQITDMSLKTIADADKKHIGVVNSDYEKLQGVLKGNIAMQEWYYDKIGAKVLEIAVPVNLNNGTIGALILGLSMKKVYTSIYNIFTMSFIISIIMTAIFLWIQEKNIMEPIRVLNKNIRKIDVEKDIDYRLPLLERDTFRGLSTSINKILDRTNDYFYELNQSREELYASNEEVTAAYGQLTASEEELRAQYDEIQGYSENISNLNQKYEIAIRGTDSAVWEFTVEDSSLYISQEFKDLMGLDFIERENVFSVFNKLLTKEHIDIMVEEFNKCKDGKTDEIHQQVQIKGKDGNKRWILIRGKGVFDKYNNLKLINGILLDITQTKEQEEYIKHLAFYDHLTNLPNRVNFIEMLKGSIDIGLTGAVMLLDLDNFKSINDTMGHVYGDKVLKQVANELLNLEDGKLIVSRFGGDEFLILIIGESDRNKIEEYAKKIIASFKNKLLIDKDEIYISSSIGITTFPYDSKDVDQLIVNADIALFKVKSEGKNNYIFFSEDLLQKLNEQARIEKILREALLKDGFKLLYQPQINTYTGKISGFEALLRLKNNLIMPDLFIPIAEETGMIIEIGRWVTKDVIYQLAKWKAKGLDLKPIAINFSAKQLNDLGYIDFLKEELKRENVEARYIEIEITEGVFLENKEETITFLDEIRALGIKIALDDFGTGYSSLSYLSFLPVDKIKLDKSLNDKFLQLDNVTVMDSIISLVHSLDLEVVAEGIEEINQYKRLRVGGCNYIQGYIFSKPLAVEDVEKVYYDNFLEKINYK